MAEEEEERPFVGLDVGGDPSTVAELATWYEQAKKAVESVADELQQMIQDLEEVWDDNAGVSVRARLHQGRMGADKLTKQLASCGTLLEECSEALSKTQTKMAGVAENVGPRLEIVEGRVYEPEYPLTALGNPKDPPPVRWQRSDNKDYQDYIEHLRDQYTRSMDQFSQLEDEADDALVPLSEALKSVSDNPSVWNDLVFPSTALVVGETKLLLEKYRSKLDSKAQHHGMVRDYWSNMAGKTPVPLFEQNFQERSLTHGGTAQLYGRMSRTSGILARLFGGPANVIIPGLEAGLALSRGERADRVLVEAGAGVTGTYLVYLAAGGAALSPGVVLACAAGGMVGAKFGELANDKFNPRTPLEILEQNDIEDYGKEGEVGTN